MKIFTFRLILFFSLFFAALFNAILAHADYGWKINRVIDGDTVEVEVDFLPVELGKKVSIRVLGVDTPEKGFRAKCEEEKQHAEKASKFTKDLISKSNNVRIIINDWDKYGGRLLGDISLDGKLLSQLLIQSGYAMAYDGGTKKSWCEHLTADKK